MRSFLMFLLGYIAGVVSICILVLFLAMVKSSAEQVNSVEKIDNHITLFKEPAGCVTTNALRVYRVLDEYYAIADEVEYKSYSGEYSYKSGAIKVVVKSEEKNLFYDDQIIEVPSGKCMRQIGVYSKYSDTYPVVKMAESSVLTTNETSSSYTKRSVEVKSTATQTETTTKSKSSKPKDDNIKLFATPTDCVSSNDFRINEVIDENYAIAEEVEYYSGSETYYTKYDGIKVVIKSEEKNKYFDEQIIKMPAGKCMRQIGVYSKYSDTYPVVKITE